MWVDRTALFHERQKVLLDLQPERGHDHPKRLMLGYEVAASIGDMPGPITLSRHNRRRCHPRNGSDDNG